MRLLAYVLLTVLSVTAAVFAQSGRQLVVTVLDATEQAVPGVTVSIEQNGTNKQTLVTDGNGQATTSALPAGTYVVKATLEGFTDAQPVTVRVSANQIARATARLGLPRLSDSVTVAGGAERPATETAVQND